VGGHVIASALATLAVAAAVAWVCGSAIAPRSPAPERLAYGILALVGLAWLAMLQGPAGVGLLGHPWVMRAIAVVLTVALLAWRRPSLRPGRISAWPIALAAAATAVVTYPGFLAATPRLWPSHEDMLWHQGWIRQLAAGVPAPGGVYAGEPNSYPWLYHSIGAWLLGTLPGDLNAALLALDVGAVAAGWLAMWLLARELGAARAAAAWAAVLFTAAAGFGWVWQHSPAASLHQNGANFGPYHGDLVLWNVLVPALGNVPPLLPRELGSCLAPFALWLLLRGLNAPHPEALWAAGAAIGFTFLISPLAGGFCIAWAIVLALAARDPRVWRTAIAGAAVAAVWLVPLGLDYHRYGGFVSITHIAPVAPSLGQTVVALGIVLPLGALGTIAILRRPAGVSALALALIVAVPAIACGAGGLLGHGAEVLGTPTLLRWSRYLPFLVLALAVPAGVAAQRLGDLAAGATRFGGVAVAVVLAAVAVPSTVLATAAAVHHAYPRPLTCTRLPPPRSLTAVAAHQPVADEVALALFSRTAASSVFLKLTHAKVRFRTWLQRPPAQQVRHARYRALVRTGTVPPGVTWVVARPHANLRGSGLVAAGSCRLGSHTFQLLRVP
jgi:hypothetical protein